MSNRSNGNGFISCGCSLCEYLSSRHERGLVVTSGGHCDPRRGYSETAEEFLKRVPDGFLIWPENHEDILDPDHY